jgi:hypothetical protein
MCNDSAGGQPGRGHGLSLMLLASVTSINRKGFEGQYTSGFTGAATASSDGLPAAALFIKCTTFWPSTLLMNTLGIMTSNVFSFSFTVIMYTCRSETVFYMDLM